MAMFKIGDLVTFKDSKGRSSGPIYAVESYPVEHQVYLHEYPNCVHEGNLVLFTPIYENPFKVGDSIRLKSAPYYEYKIGEILYDLVWLESSGHYFRLESSGKPRMYYKASEFELVVKFKVGDKVTYKSGAGINNCTISSIDGNKIKLIMEFTTTIDQIKHVKES